MILARCVNYMGEDPLTKEQSPLGTESKRKEIRLETLWKKIPVPRVKLQDQAGGVFDVASRFPKLAQTSPVHQRNFVCAVRPDLSVMSLKGLPRKMPFFEYTSVGFRIHGLMLPSELAPAVRGVEVLNNNNFSTERIESVYTLSAVDFGKGEITWEELKVEILAAGRELLENPDAETPYYPEKYRDSIVKHRADFERLLAEIEASKPIVIERYTPFVLRTGDVSQYQAKDFVYKISCSTENGSKKYEYICNSMHPRKRVTHSIQTVVEELEREKKYRLRVAPLEDQAFIEASFDRLVERLKEQDPTSEKYECYSDLATRAAFGVIFRSFVSDDDAISSFSPRLSELDHTKNEHILYFIETVYPTLLGRYLGRLHQQNITHGYPHFMNWLANGKGIVDLDTVSAKVLGEAPSPEDFQTDLRMTLESVDASLSFRGFDGMLVQNINGALFPLLGLTMADAWKSRERAFVNFIRSYCSICKENGGRVRRNVLRLPWNEYYDSKDAPLWRYVKNAFRASF